MLDLIPPSSIVVEVVQGDSPYTVEFTTTIDDQSFTFYAEGPSGTNHARALGWLAVRNNKTERVVKGPMDSATWARINAFARFGKKDTRRTEQISEVALMSRYIRHMPFMSIGR